MSGYPHTVAWFLRSALEPWVRSAYSVKIGLKLGWLGLVLRKGAERRREYHRRAEVSSSKLLMKVKFSVRSTCTVGCTLKGQIPRIGVAHLGSGPHH